MTTISSSIEEQKTAMNDANDEINKKIGENGDAIENLSNTLSSDIESLQAYDTQIEQLLNGQTGITYA